MDQEGEEVPWAGMLWKGLRKESLKGWWDLDNTRGRGNGCPEGPNVSIEDRKGATG